MPQPTCRARTSLVAGAAVALLSAWLPGRAAAQAVPIQLPKALVFPNYDSVLPGKDQALEAGAYVARAGDASANFYNPAGLVQSEKTAINASSAGWIITRVSSEALDTSVTTSKIDNVPGYFGVVIDPGTRNLRVGLSITRTVAWSPGSLDQSVAATPIAGLDRLTYSSSANFGTQAYQAALAWAPGSDRSVRLGISLGVANTTFGSSGTISGGLTFDGQPGQFLGTLRASGSEWDMVVGVGVQWDVLDRLTVGAVVRAPGVRLGASSLLTYESTFINPQAPESSFIRDENGRFEYKQPFEADIGIAYNFGNAQIEGDLRFHDATGRYDFYRTNVPLQVVTQTPGGGTAASTQALSSIPYEARRVFNASIGGNVRLGKTATLHGGFYTSMSPVADPATAPLRQADLYGFTAGVDFQFEKFGASIGAGYQWGDSPTTGIGVNDQFRIQGSSVTLQSISVLYAISYAF